MDLINNKHTALLEQIHPIEYTKTMLATGSRWLPKYNSHYIILNMLKVIKCCLGTEMPNHTAVNEVG